MCSPCESMLITSLCYPAPPHSSLWGLTLLSLAFSSSPAVSLLSPPRSCLPSSCWRWSYVRLLAREPALLMCSSDTVVATRRCAIMHLQSIISVVTVKAFWKPSKELQAICWYNFNWKIWPGISVMNIFKYCHEALPESNKQSFVFAIQFMLLTCCPYWLLLTS